MIISEMGRTLICNNQNLAYSFSSSLLQGHEDDKTTHANKIIRRKNPTGFASNYELCVVVQTQPFCFVSFFSVYCTWNEHDAVRAAGPLIKFEHIITHKHHLKDSHFIMPVKWHIILRFVQLKHGKLDDDFIKTDYYFFRNK